jgi:DNA-binding NtrC family response regulator
MASGRAGSLAWARKGSVLIVDDQEGIRELLRTVLEGEYQVAEADSGAALTKALAHEQPDVVLLDVTLPDASGLALLPAINQRWPGTQVIVLTGATADSEAMSAATEAVRRGAFGLLCKSGDFNMQQLLAGVSSAMERRLRGLPSTSIRPQA